MDEQEKEVIFIGGPMNGTVEKNRGNMMHHWQLNGYNQCNGYIINRLMLVHDSFIEEYAEKLGLSYTYRLSVL